MVAVKEEAQEVALQGEVEAHQGLSGAHQTPGGNNQGLQTCLHLAVVKNTGFLANPHIGVKNQPHVPGNSL